MTSRRWFQRIAALFRQRRLDDELEGEIAAHLELAERDLVAAGVPPDRARTIARQRFGGVDQLREAHRDVRSARWIEHVARDVRYTVASLRRDVAFTTVTVGVLALGIGANAAMFTLVDAVLLKPVPFDNPERIVRVWEAPRPGVTNSTSTLDFLDWQRLGTSFEALAAEQSVSMALTGAGDPVRLNGSAVTPGYFQVFAVRPELGRTFAANDDRAGSSLVVLSHAAWQTYFGGDPDILRRRPVLDGEARQVIGVLPAGVFDRGEAMFWTPLVFTPERMTRDWHWLSVAGRVRPGVTVMQAREQLRTIRAAQRSITPVFKRQWTIEVEPLERLLVGDGLKRSLGIAAGAVMLVLLIACANVTSLLLARGATRTRELAIRSALGAHRSRLVLQMLTETLVLCAVGAAAGIALAWALVRAAAPALAEALPATAQVSVDGRVLAFTAVIAFAVALVVGVAPALQVSRAGLSAAVAHTGRTLTSARSTMRRMLVTAEVAMSLVLLCGAFLLFMTLANLQHLDTGVRVDDVVTMAVDLPARGYPTGARASQFAEMAVERVEAVPGVTTAALSTFLPLQWITNGEGLRVPGIDEAINVRFKRVTPGYFDAFGIPVIAGRGITRSDRPGSARVIVINQALASRLRDVARIAAPVGQQVTLQFADYAGQPVEGTVQIAGVIRSERTGDPWRPDPPVVYVPLAQVPHQSLKLIVRTRGPADGVIGGIRGAIHEVDPNLPLGEIATMTQIRDRTYRPASRPAWVIGAFALVASLLAALGLYGVLAQAVAQQRREIGIRMALGAQGRTVVGEVLRDAGRMIAIGVVLGLAGTIALTRVMAGLLYGVTPMDPLALAGAAATMAMLGLFASIVPARRATRVDPVLVLRDE